MKIGYSRVSSTGQNIQSQRELLREEGCRKLFEEKVSGVSSKNRPELQKALDYCREGDVFIVTRLDRCSRSVSDLQNIIKTLNSKGVEFKCTEQKEIDTTTPNGRLMLNILSSFAEFETELRAERQADGIKSAKKRGVKFGKKKTHLKDKHFIQALEMQNKGMTGEDIALELGVARSTLYKYLKLYKSKK